MPIIEVNHVTKEYKLGQLTSLKQSALNSFNRLTGRPVEERKPFKALDDVNFSVEQGEVLGIIGHNGAGKSTMLKLLANISKPSSGSITVKGKVAPLIEVGAGLVGDLTGRENIYLNGAILGIPKSEIARKFDEIVAFAELEEFIDTPIKRYSSGMSVRLGFAIATSVESDILIVDEVLAVGDLAFQRKCLERMDHLIRHQGKTVLLVSHSIRQVAQMCSRVILMHQGCVLANGDPNEVCEKFYEQSVEKTMRDARKSAMAQASDSSGEIDLLGVEVCDSEGNPVEEVASGSPMRLRVRFRVNVPLVQPEIVLGTHTQDTVYIAAASSISIADRPDYASGEHTVECSFASYPLAPGIYLVRFAMFDKARRTIFIGENLKSFLVVPSRGALLGQGYSAPTGLLSLDAAWNLGGGC